MATKFCGAQTMSPNRIRNHLKPPAGDFVPSSRNVGAGEANADLMCGRGVGVSPGRK
jgi:hypothetical protein